MPGRSQGFVKNEGVNGARESSQKCMVGGGDSMYRGLVAGGQGLRVAPRAKQGVSPRATVTQSPG